MPTLDRIRLLPDLDDLYARAEAEDNFFGELITVQRPIAKAATERSVFESTTPEPEPPAMQATLEERGLAVIEKIRKDGDKAILDPQEEDVFEAIIALTGRPALFITGGAFITPPSEWKILEDHRATIETNCKSVGRIEVVGHPERDWWGTGFLVADEVVMTNRHVAQKFCEQRENGRWQFQPNMTAHIDYVEEAGTDETAEFALTEIIGIHDDPNVDMALFRVSRSSPSGATPPAPLRLSPDTSGLQLGGKLYVVGYPAYDHRNDVSAMLQIFGNTFEVKRLQPGELNGVLPQPDWLTHDCSTLGGNSGSCVVDLESNRVLGLHFKGSYRESNFAVALWKLKNDPLLAEAGVVFS